MLKPIITFLFALLLIVTSCRNKPKGGPIQNTWWKLVSYTANNKSQIVGEDKAITIHFDEDSANGKATCNSYFANYRPDDVNLQFSNLASTERFCDDQAIENQYFDLLRQTAGYTASKEELLLISDQGILKFRTLSSSEVQDFLKQDKQEQLLSVFDSISTTPPLHIYPVIDVDNISNYPFAGQQIDTSLYQVFESNSSDVWFESGGKVYAIGKFENYYLCRIPGRYVSSDIALYTFIDGQFKRAATVAWAWCDEGWCNQQDAWLQDLNRDGRIDLIQHYQLKDNQGHVKEERISVEIQMENGAFEDDATFTPDSSLFKMAPI